MVSSSKLESNQLVDLMTYNFKRKKQKRRERNTETVLQVHQVRLNLQKIIKWIKKGIKRKRKQQNHRHHPLSMILTLQKPQNRKRIKNPFQRSKRRSN